MGNICSRGLLPVQRRNVRTDDFAAVYRADEMFVRLRNAARRSENADGAVSARSAAAPGRVRSPRLATLRRRIRSAPTNLVTRRRRGRMLIQISQQAARHWVRCVIMRRASRKERPLGPNEHEAQERCSDRNE